MSSKEQPKKKIIQNKLIYKPHEDQDINYYQMPWEVINHNFSDGNHI